MQRLQGWVRYAAQQLPVGAKAQKQVPQEGEEDDFIYGRVAVHSDDEETGWWASETNACAPET